MPILSIHVGRGHFTDLQLRTLLVESSQLFADILKCPIDRIRVSIDERRPEMIAVGGSPVSESSVRAPYFQFVVLKGRSLDEQQQLLRGFTDLIVKNLDVEANLVRGSCVEITPDRWAIGGIPASVIRAVEVQSRLISDELADAIAMVRYRP